MEPINSNCFKVFVWRFRRLGHSGVHQLSFPGSVCAVTLDWILDVCEVTRRASAVFSAQVEAFSTQPARFGPGGRRLTCAGWCFLVQILRCAVLGLPHVQALQEQWETWTVV